ncbi:hypothetical protein D3C77_413570 [compost metagenome]
MSVRASADGCADGRQVDAVGAERRQYQRGQARYRDQWGGGHLITIGAQHGNAGHVLRGHGDHEQRNADADGGCQGKARGGPYRCCHFKAETAEVQQAQGAGERGTEQQGGEHGIAW